jgi:hypothetical protein
MPMWQAANFVAMQEFRDRLMRHASGGDALSQGAFHRFLSEFPFTSLACDFAFAAVAVLVFVPAGAYVGVCGTFMVAGWPDDGICSLRTRICLQDAALVSLFLALVCLCTVISSFLCQMVRAAWLAVIAEQHGLGSDLLSLV